MDNLKVSVLIATYNPKVDWLQEQLTSINEQNYNNIEVIVADDCSISIDYAEIENIVKSIITKFPVQFIRNKNNIGSTKTFELLTSMARGRFIAYCDQDDIWEFEKIKCLVNHITKTNSVMCYSDLSVIDSNGNAVAKSLKDMRKRLKFLEGTDLAKTLLFKNFTNGCATLIETEIAQSAIPFVENMVHDHWLALFASLNGRIAFVNQSLVQYRIHTNNQTLVLKSINEKKDYYDTRILTAYKRFSELKTRLEGPEIFLRVIDCAIEWCEARMSYYKGNIFAAPKVLRYLSFNPHDSLFELLALKLPSGLFRKLVKLIQNGKI